MRARGPVCGNGNIMGSASGPAFLGKLAVRRVRERGFRLPFPYSGSILKGKAALSVGLRRRRRRLRHWCAFSFVSAPDSDRFPIVVRPRLQVDVDDVHEVDTINDNPPVGMLACRLQQWRACLRRWRRSDRHWRIDRRRLHWLRRPARGLLFRSGSRLVLHARTTQGLDAGGHRRCHKNDKDAKAQFLEWLAKGDAHYNNVVHHGGSR